MKRLLAGILVIFILLAAAAQLFLPELVSNLIVRSVNNQIRAEQISAKATKNPALFMLDGRFDELTVSAAKAQVGRIVFQEMNVVVSNAAVDVPELLRDRRFVLKSSGKIELSGVITQEELSRYLNANVKHIKNAVVTVRDGRVWIDAQLSVAVPIALKVSLDGRIVADDRQIRFVTEHFHLNDRLGGNISGALLTEIPLADLRQLPFAVGVSDIAMDQGKVIIHMDSRSF